MPICQLHVRRMVKTPQVGPTEMRQAVYGSAAGLDGLNICFLAKRSATGAISRDGPRVTSKSSH